MDFRADLKITPIVITNRAASKSAMQEIVAKKPFALSEDSLLHHLGVKKEQGLSEHDVLERQRRFGKNRLKQLRPRSMAKVFADQFRSLIVWLLAAAAALSFYLGDLPEGLAIVVVLIINAAIGFFTELRALRSMEALRRIAQVKTRVRRAGATREADAREIVPGDIVIVEAGDVITADLRLLSTANLQCDESILTGESTPVSKKTAVIDPSAELTDRMNMVFKGTAITQGSGEGVAVATGMATELGRISRLTADAELQVSPLEKRLDRLGHKLIWLMLILTGVTAFTGVFRGRGIIDMLETSIALAVAAVPEGLPVVATLCLGRGMWRMARRNALVTRLSAVETLGATTIILTDKTGTLTENRMAVAGYRLADADITVDATAQTGRPPFKIAGQIADPSQDDRVAWALRIGTLCNNADLATTALNADGAEGTGDPMELALLAAGRRAGLERHALIKDYQEVERHAFDPDIKMMVTVHRQNSEYLFAVKGAPESVIECCDAVLMSDGERFLDDDSRRAWMERAHDAAKRGYRLLALAMKRNEDHKAKAFETLTLVGLVCLLDPLRRDVPDAIAACKAAGVRVIMLTGDHAETAAEIARQAGLGDGEVTVIEGRELKAIDFNDLAPQEQERVIAADVFARVSPEMKLKLVTLLQREGEIVAMTGDGVNDAPALKKADIGIAMGKRGTEVAREAAHMVLKDDAFPTIVAAMREGRIIFDNIRKFVVYLMSCNLSEILVVGLAVATGLPAPLLPLQILYLNLVTDVFPAFALGLSRGDRHILSRPPRDPSEPIIDRSRWVLIGLFGTLITLATLATFAGALYWLGLTLHQAISVAFITLALAQLWNVFNVRDPDSGIISNEITQNSYIWSALALCVGLIAIAIWSPGLSDILRLPPPGPEGLILAFGASFVPLIAGQAILEWTPAGSIKSRIPQHGQQAA
jgi:Ca2+-transporting ATPase